MTPEEFLEKAKLNASGLEFRVVDIDLVYVAEWCDKPAGLGPPSQVHMLIFHKNDPLPSALRFKGPASLAKITASMLFYGNSVFGEEFTDKLMAEVDRLGKEHGLK